MKGKGICMLSAAVLVVLLGCGWASADEVWLKNGDRLTGKVVSLEEGTLLFSTTYAGDISIKWKEVANLKTEEPIRIVLSDETTVHGPVLPGEGGKVSVRAEKLAEPVTMDLADVRIINPKPPKPPLSATLRVNLGASFATGNTDKEDIYADGEFVARTDHNRYTIGGLYRRSESDNVKTEDKSLGYMKYDHFFAKKWYAYANASGETDEFKDLDLRYTLGVGAGHQFIESERTNLSFEGGVSYVNENYDIAEDNSFAAGRWGLRFDHFILPGSLQYFLDHTGLQGLEDSEDLVLFTRTGFRVPFYRNLNFTAQMNWEYDKSPSPGKKESDYIYIFTIGYQWAR
jgi:putative salt-induced outer membrane protein YdiY